MPTIVQINFGWDIDEDELERRSTPERAKMFWSVDGLRWKVWLRDPERRESGGIYLFDDRAAAQAYVDGPIVEAVRAAPDSSNHSIKIFDVRDEVSAVTGAPLEGRIPPT
ncbi:MAG: YdhR family protein [Acidimicrobiales bacterium]